MDTLNFLPEEDQTFLRERSIPYQLLTEQVAGEARRGIAFLNIEIPSGLCHQQGGALVAGGYATVLVLIPKGYSKTRLDSWYVDPPLVQADGKSIDRATGLQPLFGRDWQFWSRHLTDQEWRPDVDGLETYLQYIRAGLRDI